MEDRQMVTMLNEMGFYGIDLPTVSKLKRPEYYGIQLIPEARLALGSRIAPHEGTQNERIVEYAKKMRGITSLEATNVLHIMSFTKRMSEIRRDPRYIVKQKWQTNGKTRWMVYEIEEVGK